MPATARGSAANSSSTARRAPRSAAKKVAPSTTQGQPTAGPPAPAVRATRRQGPRRKPTTAIDNATIETTTARPRQRGQATRRRTTQQQQAQPPANASITTGGSDRLTEFYTQLLSQCGAIVLKPQQLSTTGDPAPAVPSGTKPQQHNSQDNSSTATSSSYCLLGSCSNHSNSLLLRSSGVKAAQARGIQEAVHRFLFGFSPAGAGGGGWNSTTNTTSDGSNQPTVSPLEHVSLVATAGVIALGAGAPFTSHQPPLP